MIRRGFIVPVPTDRYTLGDRSNLRPNAADKESNWLPVPAQEFTLHARLYSPGPAALDGTWSMPAVEKVK
jgi:hypothetical protein